MADASEDIQIRFFYEKSAQFRVIHADGAHGGIGPSGKYIIMNLYSERRAIPREQLFGVSEQGLTPLPIETSGKEGVVREVEASAVMDLHVAMSLHDWLGKHIAQLKRLYEHDTSGEPTTD